MLRLVTYEAYRNPSDLWMEWEMKEKIYDLKDFSPDYIEINGQKYKKCQSDDNS